MVGGGVHAGDGRTPPRPVIGSIRLIIFVKAVASGDPLLLFHITAGARLGEATYNKPQRFLQESSFPIMAR